MHCNQYPMASKASTATEKSSLAFGPGFDSVTFLLRIHIPLSSRRCLIDHLKSVYLMGTFGLRFMQSPRTGLLISVPV